MANEIPPQTLETEIASSSDSDSEAEESSEEELKQLAEKIQHYRSTLPVQIKNTLSSLLSSQRPLLRSSSSSSSQYAQQQQPGISGDSHPDTRYNAGEDDHEIAEKICLLKHKISNNVAAIPIVLKRMNDYMSRFEKLNTSYDLNIHPSLKRKRAS